jgi:hypothetical protein
MRTVIPGAALYHTYLSTLSDRLWAERYSLINYGSLSYVVQNAQTHGGRWAADWTGLVEMAPGPDIVATQCLSSAQLGRPNDMSVIDSDVPLWPR